MRLSVHGFGGCSLVTINPLLLFGGVSTLILILSILIWKYLHVQQQALFTPYWENPDHEIPYVNTFYDDDGSSS
jgi:hypothetical protein